MEVLPPEHQQAGIVHGNDVRGAGFLVDDGHLAEEAALSKHREDDLPAILCDEHHLDLTRCHKEEGISRVIFEHDDAALGIAAFPGEICERGQVGFAQSGKEGDLTEDLHRGQWHSCLAGRGSVWVEHTWGRWWCQLKRGEGGEVRLTACISFLHTFPSVASFR